MCGGLESIDNISCSPIYSRPEPMSRIRPSLLALVAMLAFQHVQADEKTAMPVLSGYPQTKAIVSFFGIHTNGAVQTNLLVISEFFRDDCIDCSVLEYFVTQSGQVVDHRREADETIHSPRRRQLSEPEFNVIRSALTGLPARDSYPGIGCLVILSRRTGTNWVTHSYTRSSNLETEPKALRQILDAIGERSEARRDGITR